MQIYALLMYTVLFGGSLVIKENCEAHSRLYAGRSYEFARGAEAESGTILEIPDMLSSYRTT